MPWNPQIDDSYEDGVWFEGRGLPGLRTVNKKAKEKARRLRKLRNKKHRR